jgi:hypothetical protein
VGRLSGRKKAEWKEDGEEEGRRQRGRKTVSGTNWKKESEVKGREHSGRKSED